jgi:hypothetical protein
MAAGSFRFQWSATITEPPAARTLRLNNATASAATKIWASNSTVDSVDVYRALMLAPIDSLAYVQDFDDHTHYYAYRVAAAPIDKTGYVELPAAWVQSGLALSVPPKTDVVLVLATVSAPAVWQNSYTTLAELQRVLAKPTPTAAEQTAMQRVIDAAGEEINWDLSYNPVDNLPPANDPILADVNLNRAVELWKFNFSPLGQVPVGPDLPPIMAPRDTWYRHHLRLAPLRTAFSIA